MMGKNDSSEEHALRREAAVVSQKLGQTYGEYFAILRQAIRAGLNGENEKLFVYQAQECQVMQAINSLEHTLAALASQLGEALHQSEHIKKWRAQAIELSGQLLIIARGIEARLKTDLNAVRLTLQKLSGGKASLEALPLYIDIKT